MVVICFLFGALFGGHHVEARSPVKIHCAFASRTIMQSGCLLSRPYARGDMKIQGPRQMSSDGSFDEIFEPAGGSDSQRGMMNEEDEHDDDDDEEEELPNREISASSEFDARIPQLNVVTLSGRVGNDPEPKYFDNGNVVVNLSLAVKRKYHPLERKALNIRSGEEETDWFPLEIWGQNAEYVARFVDKGARIGITGSLVIDSWTDRNTGEDRTRPKIRVRHLDILETKAESELRRKKSSFGGGGGNPRSSSEGRRPTRDPFDETTYGDNEDDWRGGPSPAGTGGFFDP